MRVRDVMTTPAVTAVPDTPFPDLVDRLLANAVSGLPVVDGAGRPVGIVTEADLVSKEAYGHRRRRALGVLADLLRGRNPDWVAKGAGRTARDVMTAAVVVATPDEDLAAAARRMLEGGHKRLPVVDGEGRVVGIVSRHDVLRSFHRSDAEILADVDRLLGDARRVPETHAVSATVQAGVVSLEGTVQWPSDRALVEAVVARFPGVVAVDDAVEAREEEPRLSGPLVPPLR